MPRYIHCYAEGMEGQWEAVCLDFDLAVQGKTFEEIYQSLNQSIGMYVEYIKSLPNKERAAFLNRSAPFSLRFRFLWYAIRGTFNKNKDLKERHEFIAPCPA